jgi:anti-sigma B factor antagonist
MDITTTQFKHCDLVKINGRVDSSTAPLLNEKLAQITDDGRYRIVLDMAELEFMSSAGLRALIAAQKTCKRYNRGEVLLAAVPANIMSALDLAGFLTIFKTFDSVTSAVGSF